MSAFLKSHSVLANAFKEAEAVEDTKVYKIESLDEFKVFFEKHLRTQQNCDYDVCLVDGSMFDYDNDFYPGCTHAAVGSSSALKESCIRLTVDVNGNKGPNLSGKDQYNLWVTRSGIIPEGFVEPESCVFDCGAYVLNTHKIFDVANPVRYFKVVKFCKEQDEGTCDVCNNGYKLVDNQCQKLDIDKCTSYILDKCDTCEDSYYLTSANTCESVSDISEQCLAGDLDGNCTECEEGYSVNNEGTCTANIANCTEYNADSCATKTFGTYEAHKVGNTNYYAINKADEGARYLTSYWGTVYSCPAGTHLPSIGELQVLYNNDWEGKPTSGNFQSGSFSRYNGWMNDAYYYYMNFGSGGVGDDWDKYPKLIMCVGT